MPVSISCGKLLERRARQLRRALAGVRRGDATAIHAARIATRRLSELVPLAGAAHRDVRRLQRHLRTLRRRLSHLRNLDSELLLIDKLAGLDGVAPAFLSRVRDEAGRHAGAGTRRRHARRAATRVTRVLGEIDHLIAVVGDGDSARLRAFRWASRARVVRRASRVRRETRDAGAIYEPERLHRVRIAVKKLRYAVEIAHALQGDLASELRRLKEVQGILGRMHDAQMLLDRVRAVQERLDVHAAAGPDGVTLCRHLEGRCRRLHARFMREREGLLALCTRIAAYPGVERVARRRTG